MEQKINPDATCFVIMPFGSDKVTRFHSRLVYDYVIRPAFEQAKRQYTTATPAQEVLAFRIDEVFADKLKEGIVTHLRSALIVVADISEGNPNVLFELGFRQALGKPVVCISNKPESAPFWGTDFQVIDYTSPNSQDLIVSGILSGFRKVRTKTEVALESILTTVVKDGRSDSLQDRATAWRLQIAESQIQSIQAGDWLCEFKPNAAYMHHLLEGAATLLRKGEKYRSLTNGKFWLPEVDSLLTANVAAAKKGGVLIERIFVLTKDELEDAKNNPEGRLRRALDAQVDAAREVCDVTKNDQSFVVSAHITDTAREQREYGNFALLYEVGGAPSLVLEPKTAPEGDFTELRFHFLQGSKGDLRKTNYWVDRLDKAASKGKPLAEFFPVMKKKRSNLPSSTRKATAARR